MKLRCNNCRKKGVLLSSKVLVRKGRNVIFQECGTEFNYSGWSGLIINLFAAALGTLFFYLILFMNGIYELVLWFLISFVFAILAMAFVPLKRALREHGR